MPPTCLVAGYVGFRAVFRQVIGQVREQGLVIRRCLLRITTTATGHRSYSATRSARFSLWPAPAGSRPRRDAGPLATTPVNAARANRG
jgi:hypothetical protein